MVRAKPLLAAVATLLLQLLDTVQAQSSACSSPCVIQGGGGTCAGSCPEYPCRVPAATAGSAAPYDCYVTNQGQCENLFGFGPVPGVVDCRNSASTPTVAPSPSPTPPPPPTPTPSPPSSPQPSPSPVTNPKPEPLPSPSPSPSKGPLQPPPSPSAPSPSPSETPIGPSPSPSSSTSPSPPSSSDSNPSTNPGSKDASVLTPTSSAPGTTPGVTTKAPTSEADPTTASPTEEGDSESFFSSTIGITMTALIGALALIAIVLAALFLIRRKKKGAASKRRQATDADNEGGRGGAGGRQAPPIVVLPTHPDANNGKTNSELESYQGSSMDTAGGIHMSTTPVTAYAVYAEAPRASALDPAAASTNGRPAAVTLEQKIRELQRERTRAESVTAPIPVRAPSLTEDTASVGLTDRPPSFSTFDGTVDLDEVIAKQENYAPTPEDNSMGSMTTHQVSDLSGSEVRHGVSEGRSEPSVINV